MEPISHGPWPWAADDEPRWIRLSVTWTPTPRDLTVDISWTINGTVYRTPSVTHSPWPTREVAIRPGDVLVLLASQTGAGTLKCSMHEGVTLIANGVTSQPGNVKCMIIG